LIVLFLIGCSAPTPTATSISEAPTALTSSASLTATPTLRPPTLTPVPSTPTATPEPPPATPELTLPRRILFIGDSFSFWLDTHMKALAVSSNPPLALETASVTFGGATLKSLWRGDALKAVQEGQWDVVVLEEDLSDPASNENDFYDYVDKFDAEIRMIGARTVLSMPWEYNGSYQPLRTAEIAQIYGTAGTDLDVTVAPVGLAWERAIKERPALNLYFQDNIHQSIAGEYLTLAVLYATIFEQSPEGLTYLYTDIAPESEEYFLRELQEGWTGVTSDEAAFLQRIAWETVQEYQAQQ